MYSGRKTRGWATAENEPIISKAAARTTRKWVDSQKGQENFSFSDASRLALGSTQGADGKFAGA